MSTAQNSAVTDCKKCSNTKYDDLSLIKLYNVKSGGLSTQSGTTPTMFIQYGCKVVTKPNCHFKSNMLKYRANTTTTKKHVTVLILANCTVEHKYTIKVLFTSVNPRPSLLACCCHNRRPGLSVSQLHLCSSWYFRLTSVLRRPNRVG